MHFAFLIGSLVSVPFLLGLFVFRMVMKPRKYGFKDELIQLILGGLMGLNILFKSWLAGVFVVWLIWRAFQ